MERQITREIRRCMSREYESFFLRYQPVYDGKSGKPIAANTLAALDLRGVQGRYYAGSVFYDEVLDLIENAQ